MTRLDDARAEFEAGQHKKAERLLWDEKVEAAATRDRARLEALLVLVLELMETPGVRTRDLKYLAQSVRAELGMLHADPRPAPEPRPGTDPRQAAAPSAELTNRLTDLERRLDAMRAEVVELRRLTHAPAAPAEQLGWDKPSLRRAFPLGPEQVEEPSRPAAPRRPAPPPPPRDRVPSWARDVSTADLLGARSLAWAGGIVTLLGVVFLFVLAANRGWIGPEIRVGIGALVSVGVFVAGIEVKRRFGQLYSALGAVGAGIAGSFATLLAANALYGFISDLVALAAAGLIAACATAVALAWTVELIAGLGLVGAMLVPFMVPIQEGRMSLVGTGFVAILFAALALVSIRVRWVGLLVIGGAVSAVQIAVLVAQTDSGRYAVIVLAAVFTALYAATGIACRLRGGQLGELGPTILLASAILGGGAAVHLIGGTDSGGRHEGIALVVLALVYAALAGVFFTGARDRDLSAVLWAIGLTVGAVAAADLVSGVALSTVWAAEAALLGWLARATREVRFTLAGLAYLVLAAGYALGHDAQPARLFVEEADPARGVASIVAIALGGALYAWFVRTPGNAPAGGPLAALIAAAAAHVRAAAPVWFWCAGVFAAYAAALGILDVAGFDHGHVALTGFLSVVGLGLVGAGVMRGWEQIRIGGAIWLAVTGVEATAFDVDSLASPLGWYSVLMVGAAVLIAGIVLARFVSFDLLAGVYVVASAGLLTVAVVELVDGSRAGVDLEGAALLGLAVVYGVLASVVFRIPAQRDHATLEWTLALALAAVASAELLDGAWLVLAWSAAAATLVWLGLRLREPRLHVASGAYLALGLAHALALDAPPHDLFVATRHPGVGVPALVAVLAAAAIVTRWAAPERVRDVSVRSTALAALGVLALYTVSLMILELAEDISQATVATDFQRGHTITSGFWGLVGLTLLYVGLTRHSRRVQLGGFALFGASLTKIFLYDLSSLSSVQRALSFLAVGAVLLVGAFFYQRLSERESVGPSV